MGWLLALCLDAPAYALDPGPEVLPWLAVRIRIEQATALRAAVQTEEGVWHVGSTLIDAAGGGCTAPSVVRSQPG